MPVKIVCSQCGQLLGEMEYLPKVDWYYMMMEQIKWCCPKCGKKFPKIMNIKKIEIGAAAPKRFLARR